MAKRLDDIYDLIVIGSGMGGLTVAALMARMRGKKVLVLERHFRAGGFTHSFQRGPYHWDVGIHYLAQLEPGSMPAGLFDLITDGEMRWQAMPETYEKFVYPDFTFPVRAGRKNLAEDLKAAFPDEAEAIGRYLTDIKRGGRAFANFIMKRNGARLARWFASLHDFFARSPKWSLTTQAYLDQHFRDPKLKALLVSQWGDYGLPPSLSPFNLHAAIANYYIRGGYYPVGGSAGIARGAQRLIEAKGGAVAVNHRVTRVLVEQGKAVGVETCKTGQDGPIKQFRAPIIVSNAGAAVTYLELLEQPPDFAPSLQTHLETRPACAHLNLYLGLKKDPRELGFQGENHWIYDSYDHDSCFQQRHDWFLADQPQPPMVYLSFPSLKDPEAKGHTAEAISLAAYEPFARWKDQPWRRRDQDYQALKDKISTSMIAMIDHKYPGFADAVDFIELSTPITTEHFTGHHRGTIYGLPSTADRFQKPAPWIAAKSPIPGLYLTGADTGGLGIIGALMGGITTLSVLPNGIASPRIFSAAMKTKR